MIRSSLVRRRAGPLGAPVSAVISDGAAGGGKRLGLAGTAPEGGRCTCLIGVLGFQPALSSWTAFPAPKERPSPRHGPPPPTCARVAWRPLRKRLHELTPRGRLRLGFPRSCSAHVSAPSRSGGVRTRSKCKLPTRRHPVSAAATSCLSTPSHFARNIKELPGRHQRTIHRHQDPLRPGDRPVLWRQAGT